MCIKYTYTRGTQGTAKASNPALLLTNKQYIKLCSISRPSKSREAVISICVLLRKWSYSDIRTIPLHLFLLGPGPQVHRVHDLPARRVKKQCGAR